jgi:hypothetical protein
VPVGAAPAGSTTTTTATPAPIVTAQG